MDQIHIAIVKIGVTITVHNYIIYLKIRLMKTTKLLITTFLLLCIFNNTVFAQDKAIPTVTLNQETNTLDSELPFDKIFFLKIEKKVNKPWLISKSENGKIWPN